MAKQIRSLNVGDKVIGHFKGSKSLGNQPYTLPLEFVTRDTVEDTVTFRELESGDTFNVYKYNGRWSYGSSAEPFSING